MNNYFLCGKFVINQKNITVDYKLHNFSKIHVYIDIHYDKNLVI